MSILRPLSLLCVFFLQFGCKSDALERGDYPDPARFERAIERFEAEDREPAPPAGAIVCVGSSSMRMWARRIDADLSPLTLVPRGFGGSTMYDAYHYADRIITPYEPRAVLLYEGDNDIAAGISPEQIKRTFMQLVRKIHRAHPDCRVYVLSIKPSLKRWAMWPDMQQANAMLRAACEQDTRLTFIDVAGAMLDADGKPIESMFVRDRLHMNDAGYDAWRGVVRPVLIERELTHERQ